MAFPQSVKTIAFNRAEGLCECSRRHYGDAHHGSRCNKALSIYGGDWEAHHITAVESGGDDSPGNCEVLCRICRSNVFDSLLTAPELDFQDLASWDGQ